MSAPALLRGYCTGSWGQVHRRECGEGGTALVLLHQTPWSSLQFEFVLGELGTRRRAIALDTPGYGQSDAPLAAPEIADYAQNLRVVLDELGIARAVVGGHHTGALVAAAFAARYPHRCAGLLLDNAPFYTASERRERQARVHRSFAPCAEGTHFAERWRYLRRVMDPAASDRTVHEAVLRYYEASGEPEWGHAAAYRHDLAHDLARIACPTLVLASRADAIFASAARIMLAREDFSYVALDGGSSLVRERPSDWLGAVRDFLARL